MRSLPTSIIIRTCSDDGGNVDGCLHYSYDGRTIDSVQLAALQLEQVSRRLGIAPWSNR
jgi:hypothetical protein